MLKARQPEITIDGHAAVNIGKIRTRPEDIQTAGNKPRALYGYEGHSHTLIMPNLWTLGGLSVRELVRRTCSESWHDAVFGQAGRMAFYHFLAIFPSLLLFLAVVSRVPSIASELKDAILGLGKEFLPPQASSLLEQTLGELNRHMPIGLQLFSASLGALWAALNGTWALVYGLNTAYEVEERRGWWKLGITVFGLTLLLAFVWSIGLVLLLLATRIEQHFLHQPLSSHTATAVPHGLQWLIAIVLLLFSLAVIYRFAPNLRKHEWRWSTPGALCAILLWMGSTMGVRLYFEYVNDYTRTYGHLNSVVMLLFWLYLTNGAILIGGEMNSEIEKVAAERGNTHRSGS
jgi:membrane protein